MSDDDMDLFLGNVARSATTGVSWTPQQERVFQVVLRSEGNVAVVSRAGTGKSTTIIEAAKRLPERIDASLVAFNRAIADDLRSKAPKTLRVKTFHAAGMGILKSYDRACTIDEDKGMNLAREVADPSSPQKFVTAIKRAASMCKSYLVHFEGDGDIDRAIDIFETHGIDADGFATPSELASLAFRAMRSAREMTGLVDFDDQVWLPIVLNMKPKFRNDIGFVDEAQDMAENQLRLAFMLADRVVVVFDPYQGIYTWRGAGGEMFERMLASLHAEEVKLTVTFRCPKKVVKEAQQFVPDFEAAPGAQDGIVESISTGDLLTKVRPGDVVISRTNAALVRQCTAAIRAGIKSNIIGRDLGEMLTGMVSRSHADSVKELLDWVGEWKAREIEKRQAKDQDAQPIVDRAACLEAFADGAKSVPEVRRNILMMFDDVDDAHRVVFSSTHRFKGMERDRVFLLRDTYLHPKMKIDENGVKQWDVPQEEKNLFYVGITRAKKELYYVRGGEPKGV